MKSFRNCNTMPVCSIIGMLLIEVYCRKGNGVSNYEI